MHRPQSPRDRGIATPVEMMYLLAACLVALLFITYVGRLHAAGVEVTNTAQAAARAASQAANPAAALEAAQQVVAGSSLARRCDRGGATSLQWVPSTTGAWQGGSVTVTVQCEVRNQSLTGLWSPGTRTITMADTQPVDRYHR
ncbi:MAG: hypothetical protein R2694_18390 [Ilumatobacteraceae bacterium]|nr:hypothetical protein [Ilumatobacter sp.]